MKQMYVMDYFKKINLFIYLLDLLRVSRLFLFTGDFIIETA